MRRISLNGRGRMQIMGESGWTDATVPGSVYGDMLAAGRMEDPFYRDNEEKALALMDNDFTYQRDFRVRRN